MKRLRRDGFSSMTVVTGLGVLMTMSMTMVFRYTIMNRDQSAQIQLRNDYQQREEALLRGLITVFPKKAIASMQGNFAANDNYSWSSIFAEAISVSSVATGLPEGTVSDLGLGHSRNGDVADQSATTVKSWITSLTGEPDKVTPGTTMYADAFAQAEFVGKAPPLLSAPDALQISDATRPVMGPQKKYATQVAGLGADVTKYPLYNLISYPNIRFGYAEPGQPFVAKRNWWAFTVNYGNRDSSVAKHYVLSLYEVPSQMPIEASSFAKIGRYQDGTAWNAAVVNIQGAVYGDKLEVDGTYGADRLTGRKQIAVDGSVDLGGLTVGNDFDALGVREQLQVSERKDVLPIALSANSGRLAFVPLMTGVDYLSRIAGTPNTYQAYAGGGQRCPVIVEAISMVSLEDQTPTKIRVKFQTPAGGVAQVTLQRDSNWPNALEAGGSTIPFQTELTNNSRSCLTFQPSLLNAWLQANGGAAVPINHSVYFSVDPSVDPYTVKPLAFPPGPDDMCVIVRKGKDLTAFTAGMSLIAPLRVYVGDDLNDTPASTPPAGSGLAANTVYYPPVAIFGAEIRIGTTAVNRPIDHHGRLTTVGNTGTVAWQPLDIKSGSDDAVHTDSISAELGPLHSPAELPPVHQMNWLVVVEEMSEN